MADTDTTPISPVGTSKPEISVSAPSINNEPVELDSTPTSPEELRKRRGSKEDISPEEKEVRNRDHVLKYECRVKWDGLY